MAYLTKKYIGKSNKPIMPTRGLSLHAPMEKDVAQCETGQTITKHTGHTTDGSDVDIPITYQVIKNVPCVYFQKEASSIYQSYLEIASGVTLGVAPRAISIWVYGLSSDSFSMFLRGGVTGGGGQWEIGYTGVANNYIYAGSWAAGAFSTISALNTWNHVVYVYTGTHIKLYVNGVFIAQKLKTLNIAASPIYVGGYDFYSVTGYASALRIYDIEPTDEEILLLSTEHNPSI